MKVDWFEKKPDLDYTVAMHVVIAALAWATNLLFWIVSLQYTTTVRASLVASLHPLILVFYLHFTTGNVSKYEWLGVCISIGGLLIVGSDGFWNTEGRAITSVLFGDILCLVAAFGEVLVILNRRKTKQYVPLMQVRIHGIFFLSQHSCE